MRFPHFIAEIRAISRGTFLLLQAESLLLRVQRPIRRWLKKKKSPEPSPILQRIAAVILGFAGKKSHRCLSGMDFTVESKFILCCAAGVHKVRGKWL